MVTIDTIKIIERLRRTGLSDEAAREIAEIFKEAAEGTLATIPAPSESAILTEHRLASANEKSQQVLKQEIEGSMRELEQKIEEVRAELEIKIEVMKARLEKSKSDIIKWVTAIY
ncbi:MAG: hypothetical protein HQK99_00650 [Nitrospirae bacterium]|nr:hypothetical protein [Nitrospirota bacterium]